MRAWQLTGADRFRDEAIAALDTTGCVVHAALHDGTVNYTLYHWLCGNAEIPTLGRQALGSGFECYAGVESGFAMSCVTLYAAQSRT